MLQDNTKAGNLYFALNVALRAREPESRRAAMRTWGEYVHFLLRGLAKLPSYVGVVLRGIPNVSVAKEYKLHRPIKWNAFTSSTTSETVAATFFEEDGSDGIIFRITVSNGKRINPLSIFEREDEVLLWPGQEYTVTRAAFIEDGCAYIEMTEVDSRLVF